MFKYQLRKKGDGCLVYGPGVAVRIVSLLFAILLIIGSFSAVGELGFSPSFIIPAVFTLALLLVVFWHDEWIFDNAAGTAVSVLGIGPFAKRTVTSYGEILCIEIVHFHKGIADGSTAIKPGWRHKEMAALRLRLDSQTGSRASIEIVPAKREGLALERKANIIAAHTGLPLEVDRSALSAGFRHRS